MSSIPSEQILGLLEREYLRMSGKGRRTSAIAPEILATLMPLKERFGEVIGKQEEYTRESMEDLCSALDAEQESWAETNNVPTAFNNRMSKLRSSVRRELQQSVGWENGKLYDTRGNLLPTGLRGLTELRSRLGMEPLKVQGNEYMTAEEYRASLAIASILGEVTVADYWSKVAPDRFAFNNQGIQNMRRWIGDFQKYSGNFFADIPIPLLTDPAHRSIRDMLFNKLRDKYYREYYKNSIQGADPVINALMDFRDEIAQKEGQDVGNEARLLFIDELCTYFTDVDLIALPTRLREGLGEGAEFPAKHQKIAMMEIMRQKQLLLADKTGGGKTGSCIATFEHLRDQGLATRMLMMCPSHIITEWEKRLTNVNGGYFNPQSPPNVVVIREGDEDRKATWEKAKSADYVLMSIEMARSETDGKSHEEHAKELGADFFVLDEAHNVRNPKGSDTDRIFRISQCDSIRSGHLVASSATPIYNTIRDAAALLRLLNAGQQREGMPSDVDFSNINELSRAIVRNHSRLVRNLLMLRTLRREGDDCLVVGTTLDADPVPVERALGPIEQAVYDAVYDDPFYSATEKILELTRVCLHKGNAKYEQVLEEVLGIIDAIRREPEKHSGKFVIATGRSAPAKGTSRDFTNNNDPDTSNTDEYLAGRLRRDLAPMGIHLAILDGEVTGSTPLKKNGHALLASDGSPLTKTQQVIAECRDFDGIAGLWMRADCGGEGLDLSFASDARMAAPTSVVSEEQQFIGRFFRKGQRYPVTYRKLMISNSIERGRWEFGLRKARIIAEFLDGRPLTEEEEEMLNEETTRVRAGGFLSYETMTSRQKIMFIFNRMFAMGKNRIRDIFSLDNGKYARDLANLYHQEEELSYGGNNRRLILAILQHHLPEIRVRTGKRVQLADVAAGTLSLSRALLPEEDIDVWSSDLCEAMLEVGKGTLPDDVQKTLPDDRIVACSMDELPYKSGSMDIVTHSLALHYAKHNEHHPDKGGRERIDALREVNRVLRDGGLAVIALPPFLFQTPERFELFKGTICAHFGFACVEESSGHAESLDSPDEEHFESFVLTLRKTGPSNISAMHFDDWKNLDFQNMKPAKRGNEDANAKRNGASHTKAPPEGSFHEEFTFGHTTFSYATPVELSEAKSQHQEAKAEYLNVHATIAGLVAQHSSIANIPAKNIARNIDLIECDAFPKDGDTALVRSWTKKRGHFLCLAHMRGKRVRPYGKRYFVDDEFSEEGDADTTHTESSGNVVRTPNIVVA